MLRGSLRQLLPASCAEQVQYVWLQQQLQRSASAWLQQPAAAADVPRPPLALASGCNSWQAASQQASSAAAASAVADLLGLSGRGASAVAASSTAAAAAAGPAAAPGIAAASVERLLAVQVSRQALRVLLVLVRTVKCHCQFGSGSATAGLFCAGLAALQPAGLVQLLAARLLGCNEGVDYCCRALAAALSHELVAALQDSARWRHLSGGGAPAAVLPAAGGGGVPAASAGSSTAQTIADSDAGDALLGCLEPLITQVLMPVAGRQLPGFGGKALVRGALAALLAVVQGPLVDQEAWAETWAAIGGTFWLSR